MKTKISGSSVPCVCRDCRLREVHTHVLEKPAGPLEAPSYLASERSEALLRGQQLQALLQGLQRARSQSLQPTTPTAARLRVAWGVIFMPGDSPADVEVH